LLKKSSFAQDNVFISNIRIKRAEAARVHAFLVTFFRSFRMNASVVQSANLAPMSVEEMEVLNGGGWIYDAGRAVGSWFRTSGSMEQATFTAAWTMSA
jgi:hypothetical protein